MNCNGTRPNIFVAVYLMIVLFQFTTGHQASKSNDGRPKEEGLHGDLYDVFKKRLNSFKSELSIGVNNLSQKKQPEVKTSGVKKEPSIIIMSDSLYEKFKSHLDKFTKDISLNGQHSLIDDKLYEEFKKRLDKFSSELSLDARKVFQEVTTKEIGKNKAEKRSSINQDCTYDFYKNKWDKISNILALSGENYIDRYCRSFEDILNVLGLNKSQPNAHLPESKANYKLNKFNQDIVNEPQIMSELKIITIPKSMEQRKINPLRIELKKLSLKEIIDEAKTLNNADIKVELISENERLNLKNSLKKFLYDDYKKQMEKVTNAFSKSKSRGTMRRRSRSDMVHVAPDENVLMPADFNKLQLSRHTPKGSVFNNVVSSNRLVDLNFNQPNPIVSQTEKHSSKNVNCRHTVTTEKLHKKVNREIKNDQSLPPYSTDSGAAAYPSVLVKALEASLSPQAGVTSGESLLAHVAKQLNITPLELARQLTSSKDDLAAVKKDPKLGKLLEQYFKDTGKTAHTQATERKPKHLSPSKTHTEAVVNSASLDCDYKCDDSAADIISSVLDKVLSKLESLQNNTSGDIPDKSGLPDGTPCDIVGSWNSKVLGLRFQINIDKSGTRSLAPAEGKNKLLSIESQEYNPKRHHDIMDTEWTYMGSAIRQFGGPFYIFSQKRDENVLATFAGFCRSCGGIDTIFGSWTFMLPSKDCQDISTSIVTKRDIFRRDNMESKRTEHYKDYLYKKKHRKKKN